MGPELARNWSAVSFSQAVIHSNQYVYGSNVTAIIADNGGITDFLEVPHTPGAIEFIGHKPARASSDRRMPHVFLLRYSFCNSRQHTLKRIPHTNGRFLMSCPPVAQIIFSVPPRPLVADF